MVGGSHKANLDNITHSFDRWPVLLDSVVQSHGVGFVGTDMSTMSLLAKRRTEDWARGATRMVKWGFIGADDH